MELGAAQAKTCAGVTPVIIVGWSPFQRRERESGSLTNPKAGGTADMAGKPCSSQQFGRMFLF